MLLKLRLLLHVIMPTEKRKIFTKKILTHFRLYISFKKRYEGEGGDGATAFGRRHGIETKMLKLDDIGHHVYEIIVTNRRSAFAPHSSQCLKIYLFDSALRVTSRRWYGV